MQQNNQITKEDKQLFHSALLAVHNELEGLKKTEGNPFFKSKYIPLPDMIEAVRPVLQKYNFILSQPVDVAPANGQSGYTNVVFSQITHAPTGINEMAKLALPVIEDMQKLGGAITYARRYTLSALLGLMEQDDDGNTATGKNVKPKKGGVSKQDSF